MRLPKDQPFWTSVILHLVVLLGLFFATIVEAFRPKEEPHIFEMVAAPTSQQVAERPSPEQARPDLAMPDLPPVPDLVTPRPPEPTPEPAPIISREDFIRRYGEPKPRQPTRTTPARPRISVPKIDLPKLVVPSNPSLSNPRGKALTAAQLSALGSYSAQLRAKIDAAWAKPKHLGGIQIAATVVFDVSSSGRITNARLKPGSGNASFDQSVLTAFRRFPSAGPTPTGEGYSFSMTFRMMD